MFGELLLSSSGVLSHDFSFVEVRRRRWRRLNQRRVLAIQAIKSGCRTQKIQGVPYIRHLFSFDEYMEHTLLTMRHDTHTQRVLDLASRKGMLRPGDLDTIGAPRVVLTRMTVSGLLEKAGRGIYRLPGNHCNQSATCSLLSADGPAVPSTDHPTAATGMDCHAAW